MKKKSNESFNLRLKAAQFLFYLNAIIWLGFSVYLVLEMAYFDNGVSTLIIGLFMLGNAGAMLLSGIMLGKRNKWFYYFAILVLAINIILAFTDQLGLADLVTFMIDGILLGILISLGGAFSNKS